MTSGQKIDKSVFSAALTSGSVGIEKYELLSRSSHMNAERKKLTLVRETDGEYPIYGDKTPTRNERNKIPLLLSDETENAKPFLN